MNTVVDADDIIALLEDGPKKAAQLAEWLSVRRWEMSQALARFAAQGLIERHGYGRAARWSLAGADRRPVAQVSAATVQTAILSEAVAPARQMVRRVEDEDMVSIWNGRDPLPGAGAAAGLGSTLSGGHFHVGKR